MSDPIREYTLQGLFSELMSASSALHMPPRLLPGRSYESGEFLSDIDEYVQHSLSHIRMALHIACHFNPLREELRTALGYIYAYPDAEKAQRHLAKVCKILDINLGVINLIDPADHTTFEYINDCDFSIPNSWNLWICEVWREHQHYDMAKRHVLWLFEEKKDA